MEHKITAIDIVKILNRQFTTKQTMAYYLVQARKAALSAETHIQSQNTLALATEARIMRENIDKMYLLMGLEQTNLEIEDETKKA